VTQEIVRAQQWPRYRWWVLANVALVNFLLMGFAWNYLIMLVPSVLEDLELELSDWGLLWAATSLGVCLLAIASGALADRYGVRRVASAGLLLAAASLLMRLEVSGLASFFVSMLLFGVALGTLITVLPKAIGVWFPPDQFGMANGVAQSAFGVGFTIMGLTTPTLAEAFGGWRGLSEWFAWATLAVGAIWLFTVRDRHSLVEEASLPVLASVRRVLGVRDVSILALCYGLYMGGYLGATGYLPTFFMGRGVSADQVGIFFTYSTVSFALSCLILPTLSDWIGRRKVVYCVSIALAGAGIFACVASDLPLALMAICWGGGSGGSVLVFAVPLEMDPPGPSLAGAAVGVAVTGGFVGGVIGPLIGMSLLEKGPLLGFGFWTSWYFASALFFALLRETGRAARVR